MVVHAPRQSGSRLSLGSTTVKGKSPKRSHSMIKKPTKKAATTTRSRTGPTRARVNRVKAEPPTTPKARKGERYQSEIYNMIFTLHNVALNDISLNNASHTPPKSAVTFSKATEIHDGWPQMISLLRESCRVCLMPIRPSIYAYCVQKWCHSYWVS